MHTLQYHPANHLNFLEGNNQRWGNTQTIGRKQKPISHYPIFYTTVNDAFAGAGHDRMAACYHSDNPASARILAKTGFEVIGACSSFSKAQGRDVPVTNMALSRARWLWLAQNTLAT